MACNKWVGAGSATSHTKCFLYRPGACSRADPCCRRRVLCRRIRQAFQICSPSLTCRSVKSRAFCSARRSSSARRRARRWVCVTWSARWSARRLPLSLASAALVRALRASRVSLLLAATACSSRLQTSSWASTRACSTRRASSALWSMVSWRAWVGTTRSRASRTRLPCPSSMHSPAAFIPRRFLPTC